MISTLYSFFKEKKEVIAEFNIYSRYMSCGSYVFDNTITFITLDEYHTRKRSAEILRNIYKNNKTRGYFVLLLKKLKYKKQFKVSEHNRAFKDFKGTIFYSTKSCNKIFDLSSNKVLSIYLNKSDYKSFLDSHKYFKEHFPLPNILVNNVEERSIIEELILFQPNRLWLKEDYLYVIEDIFKRYITYAAACIDEGKYHVISLTDYIKIYDSTNDKYISEIRSKIPNKLLEMQLPTLRLHGDLWTTNILIQKSENSSIYYIDWEFSQELLFFYDFFNLMWVEVYNNNNYVFLENYIKGMYDHYFKAFFSIFNLKYEPKYRVEYFHVFFLQFYLVRLVNSRQKDKNKYYKKYKELSEKLVNNWFCNIHNN